MKRQPSYGKALAVLLMLAVWLPAQAQDSPQDSTRATRQVRSDSLVSPFGMETGRAFGVEPVKTPEADGLALLGLIPSAFLYDFGDTGWADGLSLNGRSPQRALLALDGIPFTDLFTERPQTELLPAAVLGRFRLEDTRFGRPGALNAFVRPFSGSTPITELKFETGQEGLQYVSVSHAQTRTPPGLLGGASGRLSMMGHVSGTQSDGLFTSGSLRAWQALGRISLSRPGFAATLTEFHAKHTIGARAGVLADFPAAYNPSTATVLDPLAERETVRNDLALTIRVSLGSEPLMATAFWTRQHERYTLTSLDTSLVRGNRFGGHLTLPLRSNGHHISLEMDGWWDDEAGGQMNPFAGIEARTQLHATLADLLSVSGWKLNAEAGVHSVGGDVFPSGSFRVEHSGAFVGLGFAGHVPGRVEMTGYAGRISGLAAATSERTTFGDAGFAQEMGSVDVQLRGFANLTTNPRALVDDGIGEAAFVDLAANLQRAGGSLTIAWRGDAQRGFYVRTSATAIAVLNPDDSSLHRREADALPSVWANGRFGIRAVGLFGNNLDLDLAMRGRAWSAFRSRTFIPAAALFALPASTSPDVPTSGVLDIVVEARLQRRATLFLLYENVLATRTYDGAFIVPVYPLPAHRVRFGLFWTLFG
ncbi:MAG: hypothetical protein IIC18_00025 [Bacteroidetes bacterium]|nr:hypothetical protein [Bacteroidota bacterium]